MRGSAPHYPAAAVRDDFDDAKQKAVDDFADDLAKIGEWCEKEDWFAEAERLFERAIEIDRDNKRARKGLGTGAFAASGCARTRSAGETRSGSTTSRSRSASRRPRRTKLKRMLKVLDKFEEEIATERREAELWALLDAYPNEAVVRGASATLRAGRAAPGSCPT